MDFLKSFRQPQLSVEDVELDEVEQDREDHVGDAGYRDAYHCVDSEEREIV